MYPHHAQTIENLVAAFGEDPAIHALLLGGSIAHGFAQPESDVDVSIVVSTEEFERRQRENRLHYNNRELCTYEGGYIDGKYMDLAFLQLVAARGSDPARYAFEGSRVLFSRVEGLDTLLAEIARYPIEQKRERIDRFVAQLFAWRWYYSEAIRKQSDYLKFLAIQKLILFGCRLVLVENEMFFPYHKWMLRLVETAPRQPAGFQRDVQTLLTLPPWDAVNEYCLRVLEFLGVDPAASDALWPTRFMKDTELRWTTNESCIDDI